MNVIIANSFGFVALILSFIMYQKASMNKMLFTQIFYAIFMCLEYLFLSAYVALFASLVSLSRAIIFFIYTKKDKKIPIFWPIIIIITMIIIQIFTYRDLFSLIPMIIVIVYTLILQNKNINLVKKVCLVLSSLWIIYDLHVLAYLGALTSLIDIISIIIFLTKKRH